jgi:hypothetical protein
MDLRRPMVLVAAAVVASRQELPSGLVEMGGVAK